MDIYGLVGFPLGHSFSKRYFEEKFKRENIDARFLNFELASLSELKVAIEKHYDLKGFSVTIPYKEQIFSYLDKIDETAQQIGAVNSVKVEWENDNYFTTGYNTDCYGFGKSLDEFLHQGKYKALILGTGGASKAVAYALKQRGIEYVLVSRTVKPQHYTYENLTKDILNDYRLIVNTTPLGTFPHNDTFPRIPYEYLSSKHFLFDLVYNPELTTFLAKGKEQGASICNGYAMLVYQAEHSWNIWNQ